jgi:hypothetical protein
VVIEEGKVCKEREKERETERKKRWIERAS